MDEERIDLSPLDPAAARVERGVRAVLARVAPALDARRARGIGVWDVLRAWRRPVPAAAAAVVARRPAPSRTYAPRPAAPRPAGPPRSPRPHGPERGPAGRDRLAAARIPPAQRGHPADRAPGAALAVRFAACRGARRAHAGA